MLSKMHASPLGVHSGPSGASFIRAYHSPRYLVCFSPLKSKHHEGQTLSCTALSS